MTSVLTKEQRDELRRLVSRARALAEDAVTVRLRSLGLWSSCETDHAHKEQCYLWPADKLRLDAEEAQLRDRILAAVQREAVGFGDIAEPERTRSAIQRYLQGCAFTFVNRLAALRAMEVRGLIAETLVRRDKYGDRSLRERRLADEHPELGPDDLLAAALEEGFKEAGEEVAVLFDPSDPYALVKPDARRRRDLLLLFGHEIREEFWQSDDILGWIYQFYNEEARRNYKRRGHPDPDDVPVINQFYTTPWLVHFLVDNTLGRVWIDAGGPQPHGGVRDVCRYLLEGVGTKLGALVRHPREIRVLDPACGSGHFLLYAFDVLWRIWRQVEPELSPEETAAAILEHNLFGVDIDLRACQLAALGLYLKAKTYAPKIRVRALNIICADVRLLDGERRKTFLVRFEHDPELKALVEKLLETLGYTFEIGSLLKVRQPFEKLFASRRATRTVQAQLLVSGEGQARLAPEGAVVAQRRLAVGRGELKSDEGMVIPRQLTLNEVREALRRFEQEALECHDMGSQLFAADAERSVGLLSLLSEQYDVVLMNPPYGDMPATCKAYAKEHYKRTHSDYYSAFIEQAIDLCKPEGYVGALTGRTFLFLKSHQKLREEILREEARPGIVLDLGFNVLDGATARWAAFTLRKRREDERTRWQDHEVLFFRLTPWDWDDKRVHLEEALRTLAEQERVAPAQRIAFRVTLGELAEVPGSPYSYWAPQSLRELFRKYPPLDRDVAKRPDQPKIADVKQGLASADDARFTRFWWEVPVDQIATSREETRRGKKWVPFARGASPSIAMWYCSWTGRTAGGKSRISAPTAGSNCLDRRMNHSTSGRGSHGPIS